MSCLELLVIHVELFCMCEIDVLDLQACDNACELAGIHWSKFIFFEINCVR